MKILYCDMLKCEIGIYTDWAEAEKNLSVPPLDGATARAGMSEESPAGAYLFMGSLSPHDTLEGLLVHEIIHLCDYVFEYKGIETRSVNSEVKALFCEWAYDSIRPMLRKGRGGKVEFNG